MHTTFAKFLTNKNKISQVMLSFLLPVWLFGCAAKVEQTPLQPTQEWLANKAQLEKIQHFEVKGKVTFSSATQNIAANFQWQQQQDNINLRLTHFLGGTLLKLELDASGVRIIDHQGNQHVGEEMSSLIAKLTGVNLPVAALSSWLKGLPVGDNHYQLNNLNTLTSLSQYPTANLGWQIGYSNYARYNGVLLPRAITMTQPGQQVTLAVSQWRF